MKQIIERFAILPGLVALLFGLNIQLSTARGTTFVWTNTAGGNWSVAANWSPNGVPGQLNSLNSTDDVLITNAGTYTVVLDEGTSPAFWDIRSLTLGGASGRQTLAMTNKILYVAPLTVTNGGVLENNGSGFHASILVQNGGHLDSFNGVYYVSPFTIGGGAVLSSTNDQYHSPLVVSNGATFSASGSTIEGDGSLESDGALTVPSGNFTLDGTATNSGAITISNGASLSVNSALTLGGAGGVLNLPGGTVNLSSGNGIRSDGGAEYFVNEGTLNAAGSYVQSVSHFTNSGAIYVGANTLNVGSDLHLDSTSSLNVQFNSALSYGKIAINGNGALNGEFAVTLGAGYNPQTGDAFQPVTYNSYSGNFNATNLPTLVPWQFTYGSTALTVQAVTEMITWTNTAGGNWSNPNNWSPNKVPGGSNYGNADDVLITNAGTYTVNFDEGTLASPYYLHSLTIGGSGSGFQTLAISNKWPDVASMSVNFGGRIDSSGNHWFNNWVTPLAINDRGFFNSTNDLFDQDLTVSLGGNLSVANSTNGNGALTIDPNGALTVLSGAFVLNGRTTNSGTLTINSGADLSVNNNLVLLNSGYLWNKSGGAINISNGHGITGGNNAETLNNQGNVYAAGGFVQSVPNFTNSGAIDATTGTLSLDSGLHLASTGSLNVQLNSPTDYGKIAIAGNAALGGAFGVTLNYSPGAGDSFTPLTYGSYSGNFSGYNLPALDTGGSWTTALGSTALTLQVQQTITWTNTAGGNWSTAANWNPNRVPGQFDDVAITTPGTYTVTMDPGTVNIRSLTLGAGSGAQTLVISDKTLYANPLTINGGGIMLDAGTFAAGSTYHTVINVQSGGQLMSTNGTFYGPITVASGGQVSANGYYSYDTFHGTVTVGAGGLFSMASGNVTVPNDGSLTVSPNGEFDIAGGTYLQLQGPLTNSGTMDLFGNNGGISQVAIFQGSSYNYNGEVWNLPGGTVSLNSVANGYSIIATGSGSPVFINRGAIISRTSSPSGHTIQVGDFDNIAGVVSNFVGTMSIDTFSNTLAGVFYSANGTAIQFMGGTVSQPLTPGTPLVLAGAGQFNFASGWLELTNDIIPNLQLAGGYLELAPTFQDGTITNLALDGITLTNLSLPVTNGIFAVTNSAIYGQCVVQNGGQLIAVGTSATPTFHGDVTIEQGGFSSLASGSSQVASDGSVTIDAGGTLNIQGSAYLYLYGPLTNSGTVYFAGNNNGVSEIVLYNDGTVNSQGGIWNFPGGTISLNGVGNGYSIVQSSGQKAYFINRGEILNSPGSQPASISTTVFDTSAGVVTNLSGILNLSTFSNTLAGIFYAATGSTIQLSGGTGSAPLTPGNPLALTGGGQFKFTSGWLDLPGDIIPNLQLVGGVLELGAGFQGGAITNLALDGITLTNLTLAITNGTFAVTNSIVYGNGIVEKGGQWIATGNPVPTFHGNWKIESGGLFSLPSAWAEIGNDGSLTVDSNGTVNIQGGAYLELYGPMTNSGTVNLIGNGSGVSELLIYNNGTAAYQGGLWNLPGGRINLNGVANDYSILQTGTGPDDYFINQGALVCRPGSPACIVNLNNFTNSGSITAQSGTLNLNKVSLQPSGSLNSQLNSASDYGKFTISGAATLAGAFNATLGGNYVPPDGTTFNVLSYGSYSGSFASYDLPVVVTWQTRYGGTQFSLVVGQPQFAVSLSGTNLVFNANGGISGNQAVLLTSTNLAQPLASWTPVTTNAFDTNGHFSITNAMNGFQQHEFYILKLQ